MADNQDKEQDKILTFRNKRVIFLAIICLFILVVIVVIEYVPPEYKEFSTESFYVGNRGTEDDPREAWNNLNASMAFDENMCSTDVKLPSAYDKYLLACPAPRYIWLVAGDGEYVDISYIQSKVQDGALCPYNDGDYIISPNKLRFINSNVDQTGSTEEIGVYIEAYSGNDYILRWENVKSWWCHIGKENPNKHTNIVGKSGEHAKVAGGYVIGQANADTKVYVYKVDAEGNRTQIAWEDFYKQFGI